MTFVKSASTKTPVAHSQVQLERILQRYGCTGFGVHRDYAIGKASVTFRVPDTMAAGALTIPVRLEINTRAVWIAMYQKRAGETPTQYGLEQAERVAWRQLILWVDAACSAAAAGVQSISEAFFAHTLVQDGAGGSVRLAEYADKIAGSGGWRALLAPPKP